MSIYSLFHLKPMPYFVHLTLNKEIYFLCLCHNTTAFIVADLCFVFSLSNEYIFSLPFEFDALFNENTYVRTIFRMTVRLFLYLFPKTTTFILLCDIFVASLSSEYMFSISLEIDA